MPELATLVLESTTNLHSSIHMLLSLDEGRIRHLCCVGAFGTVYKAVLDDVHAVAVKMLAAHQLKQVQLQAFVNEVCQLAMPTDLSSFLQLHGTFVPSCHFCWLVMSFPA